MARSPSLVEHGTRVWLRLVRPAVLQPEGEQGAGAHGLAGVRQQMPWHGGVADHRVAPVVERDQFGQQLGAQATAVAGDGIDP
jgi:hypothetical protein